MTKEVVTSEESRGRDFRPLIDRFDQHTLRVIAPPEWMLDRLFDWLDVPEEDIPRERPGGSGFGGSKKTVVLEDGSQIQISREYWPTDMTAHDVDPTFTVAIGDVEYRLDKFSCDAIDIKQGLPLTPAQLREDVEKIKVPDEEYILDEQLRGQLKMKTALVNWTKESIRNGKITESPFKQHSS